MANILQLARWQTERLDAFLRVANWPDLRGDQLIYEMLSEGAALLRPGHAFGGTLGHIDGPDFVFDAAAGRFGVDEDVALNQFPIGKRVARAGTLDASDIDGARTFAIDDCQMRPDVPAGARASGVRSLISTRFKAGGAIRVLTFGSNDAPSETSFDQIDNVYIELLGSFFARHIELEHMQHSLVAAELKTRQHAERLAALSETADSKELAGDELLHALLRQASETIRPAQQFGGFLGRIDGEEIVVIALSTRAHDATRQTRLRLGERKPLAQTVIPRGDRTQYWDDLATLPEPPLAVAALGWRALISTLFEASGERYVLTFASPEPASIPFGGDDLVYVDVVAASIAKRLELAQLNDLLLDEKEMSSQQADRLEALLSIASIPTIRGNTLMRAMMGQAASDCAPGNFSAAFSAVLKATRCRSSARASMSQTTIRKRRSSGRAGTRASRERSFRRRAAREPGIDLAEVDTYSTGARDLGGLPRYRAVLARAIAIIRLRSFAENRSSRRSTPTIPRTSKSSARRLPSNSRSTGSKTRCAKRKSGRDVTPIGWRSCGRSSTMRRCATTNFCLPCCARPQAAFSPIRSSPDYSTGSTATT